CWYSTSSFTINANITDGQTRQRTVLAKRKILPFLMRAAHIALAHRHLLDAVMEEELLYLLLHLRVRHDICGDPALDDRLGTVTQRLGARNAVGGEAKRVRDDGRGQKRPRARMIRLQALSPQELT